MNSLIRTNAFILTLFLTAVGLFSYFSKTDNLAVMNNSEGIELPIIMYHSILKDTELSGKYVVTPTTLENDLSFIEQNGYTTVSMGDVIDYVENDAELPNKPIMLTFDDGCYNNYGYALPILEAHNARAVFCIVGEYAEQYSKSNIANLTYGYMRWSDVRELVKSPSAEIANHSYAFHSNTNGRNGAKKKLNEDVNSYCELFKSDTEIAQELFEKNVGFEPIIYTYPFGAYSEESFDLLKSMGFKATFSCNEGINIITHDSDLYLLKRYNRPSGISSEEFFSKLYRKDT